MNHKSSLLYGLASQHGLAIGRWSPGDGVTRYRFFKENHEGEMYRDYDSSDGIFTALGQKEAITWVRGWVSHIQNR